MHLLELGKRFNREQIHNFFGGQTTFTPGAGTWGLQGMLRTVDDKLSWVFFVTLGHKEGQHFFDEGITEEGVLTWQSQPKLSLESKDIQDLIDFDHDKHNIYLFFRENKKNDYLYLGNLAYLVHDLSREKPVYFEWQLLDWEEVKGHLSLNLIINSFQNNINVDTDNIGKKTGLSRGSCPEQTKSKKKFNRKFSGNLNLNSSRQKAIGDLGEDLVYLFEKQRLIESGFPELAQKVEHSSRVIGDGLGYDIKSFNVDGTDLYIEVKATTQSNASSFYMSLNELEFAKLKSDAYVIYRVYALDEKNNTGLVYEIPGSKLLNKDEYNFEPTQFKINLTR